jgi:uncharacterized protein (DUF488 family)
MGEWPLVTFGHGTAAIAEITSLLRGAGVVSLIDVRTAPGSRRNPAVARTELERSLPESGIDYRWEKRLGGFRKVPRDSPDVVWRNDAFRGYAAHMRTDTFLGAVAELLVEAAERPTGVMCSESVWWRCHRRMIADFALYARGVPVRHLMHDGRLETHRLSEGARLRDDGLLVYDGGQQQLPA